MKNVVFLLLLITFSGCTGQKKLTPEDYRPPELKPVTFTYTEVTGIGHETGCTRP